MVNFLRKHIATVLVAMVAAAITAAVPAVGHGVRHSRFSHKADKLDGRTATSFLRANSNSNSVVNTGAEATAAATLLRSRAPTRGGFLIDLSFTCRSNTGSGETRWDITPKVDGESVATNLVLSIDQGTTGQGDSASGSFYVPVTAGSHPIGYSASREGSGTASLDCNIFITSLFVPFRNDGRVPTP